MMQLVKSSLGTGLFTAFALALAVSNRALGHCDGMDGPVVKAAQKGLETGDVNLVLIWVRAHDEPEIRSAFEKRLAVRKLSEDAKHLADTWFFETLVRVHRDVPGSSSLLYGNFAINVGEVKWQTESVARAAETASAATRC